MIKIKIVASHSESVPEGQLSASDFINVSGVGKQDWEKVNERWILEGVFAQGGQMEGLVVTGGPADHTLCCKSMLAIGQGHVTALLTGWHNTALFRSGILLYPTVVSLFETL